jgi:hypothetical protein
MNPDKDYYAVLGVLPDAEDIVIRAAYRALAQRYHPDHFAGMQDKAHARMSELNEAYAVLSDAEKRTAYDQLRGAKMRSGGSEFSDTEEKAPPGNDPLDKDWRIALKYYPDLAALEKRLAQFSWKLANAYRAYLLETQQFEPRASLASLMETDFLKAYFGDNERNVEFARRLIIAKQRQAALALNEAIRVLGSNADPGRVIMQIARDFDVKHLAVNKEKICSLLSETRAAAHTSLFTQLLSELGGTFAYDGYARSSGRATVGEACKVEFDGRTFDFPSEYEFKSWFRREVLPMAEQLAH